MNGALADILLEMGYRFTSSIDECQNALIHFGLQELKPAILARMLTVMIQTHSGLKDNTQIYVSQHSSSYLLIKNKFQDTNSVYLSVENEKNSVQTWNVEIFVLTINDLVCND